MGGTCCGGPKALGGKSLNAKDSFGKRKNEYTKDIE